MLRELVAHNTDCRYRDDIRYREYTTSERRARLFARIPKVQFTDSGHGIVFTVRRHSGPRKETNQQLASYVFEHMQRLSSVERLEKEVEKLRGALAEKEQRLAVLRQD